jgi:hypothetical protein
VKLIKASEPYVKLCNPKLNSKPSMSFAVASLPIMSGNMFSKLSQSKDSYAYKSLL